MGSYIPVNCSNVELGVTTVSFPELAEEVYEGDWSNYENKRRVSISTLFLSTCSPPLATRRAFQSSQARSQISENWYMYHVHTSSHRGRKCSDV